MKVSVCMAAYRGERYIGEQIRSILSELRQGDELLVSDDAPGGETERIVRAFAQTDARVRYLRGEGKGVVRNFERVLTAAAGDVLFLSDQDDVWLPGKVDAVLREIENGACLVVHDARVVDESLQTIAPSFFALRHSRAGFLRNFLRNSYMGCCMALTRPVLERALPFPPDLPMHDQWLGLAAEKYGRTCFLPQPYLLYRQHGGNVTGGKTTFSQKVRWRIALLRALFR
ncbi:MAG: glycosyltransferase family 2 protein [Clostridia bacterium]|nr:glycosyltransferase family 2 protein [Clostridia bacterium]